MPVFYDQLHREIELPGLPQRIISVVPSQTELLFYLGLAGRIVGITKFCVHPADKFKTVAKIGGTKTLNIEKIKSLKPDLIIANKEENDQSQIEELMNHFPVWISDISNLPEAVDMIERVGAMIGKTEQAKTLSAAISQQFNCLAIKQSNIEVAYLIWRKPYMAAGKNTFIDDLLTRCGLINAFEAERYPEVDAAALTRANPNVVFLSSEPYPFEEKHFAEFKAMLPNAKIKLVDGEFFSWYGSRLLEAPKYFESLMNDLI